MQKYLSDKTSVNIVPRIYKQKDFKSFSTILDYGGGKFDTAAVYVRYNFGSTVLVFDPYNRTEKHNAEVLQTVKNTSPDYIVCANVLNVICEEDIIYDVLTDIRNLMGVGTIVYLQVYEGNKGSKGAVTTRGYQRNQKSAEYMPYIKKVFKNCNISLSKSIFTITR